MTKIEEATSMQQLGDLAVELATVSMKQYQALSTQAWEVLTGTTPMDSDEAAKGYTTFVGTMARDVGNAVSILQQAVKLATPTATPPPTASTTPPKARKRTAKGSG
jgi:hypothetical protein